MNQHKPRLVIGLLSHYLEDPNLGCVALSISNMRLMDQVAKDEGIDLEYRLLLNENSLPAKPRFSSTPYEYRTFNSSKSTLRHPIKYVRSDAFRDCDLVVNINAGDGFTDLYSFGRMLAESYMMLLAQSKGVPTLMAPQTIGPFQKWASRRIAARVMSKCIAVFSRDGLSTDLATTLSKSDNVIEVIDVAFALPFQREAAERSTRKLNVGVNVSGLLFRGGYDRDNYFNLAVDYRLFILSLVARLQKEGHLVHLVSHVFGQPGSIEDDYSASEEVAELFPEVVLAPRFEDPVSAKNYIASLDFFTGARMHATIAAHSSGTPVVPIGYSKKLNGLYDTLKYPFYIDIRDTKWSVESATDQVIEWISEIHLIQDALRTGSEIFRTRLDAYCTELRTVMTANVRFDGPPR